MGRVVRSTVTDSGLSGDFRSSATTTTSERTSNFRNPLRRGAEPQRVSDAVTLGVDVWSLKRTHRAATSYVRPATHPSRRLSAVGPLRCTAREDSTTLWTTAPIVSAWVNVRPQVRTRVSDSLAPVSGGGRVESGQVTILDGSTFVVSDARGDVDAGPAQVQGLFYRDMRHLSTWRLLLDGRPLDALASDLVEYDCAAFFLVVPTGTVYASPTVSLIRRRTVGDGMREELTVRNSSAEAVSVQLMMVFGSDFADIFEVKDAETKKGRLQVESGEGSAVLTYTRGDFGRQTTITAAGATFSRGSLMFPIVLEPGQTWTGEITVAVGEIEATVSPKPRSFHSAPAPNMDSDLAEWVAAAPSIDCDWDGLRHIYERSITDLAALRFYPDVVAGTESLPAAGLPWFMALFGRDSLLTSYQALPFVPELAATTLRALAARQASEVKTTSATLNQARFCTSCGSGNSPTSGSVPNPPTTAAPTRHPCF